MEKQAYISYDDGKKRRKIMFQRDYRKMLIHAPSFDGCEVSSKTSLHTIVAALSWEILIFHKISRECVYNIYFLLLFVFFVSFRKKRVENESYFFRKKLLFFVVIFYIMSFNWPADSRQFRVKYKWNNCGDPVMLTFARNPNWTTVNVEYKLNVYI